MKIQDTDYAEQIESCASELRGSDHVLQRCAAQITCYR